ncbi:MAG: potassium transporter TrkG [Pseudomonadota bacterium]
MGLISVIRGLGLLLVILGIAMMAPLALAVFYREEVMAGFLVGAAVTILFGVSALFASAKRAGAPRVRAALGLILLGWVVTPVFAAIPFHAGGLTPLEAYFEAVSALTTTGAWINKEAAIANSAEMFWRAELQWLGGLASLATAAAIFIRPAFIGIDTLLPPFARGEDSSYIRPLMAALRAFLPLYALLTFLAFVALAVAGSPILEASVMAMSLVSTGGFIPHTDGINGFSPTVHGVVFPFLLFGGANFVVMVNILRQGTQRSRDIETNAYLLIVLWVGVLFWIMAGAEGASDFPQQMLNAASAVSTNGFFLGEKPALVAALVTSIIGGAAVSTAGGFKVLRWLVITRRAREEIRRLAAPNAVFGKRRVANELGVWMHFLMFTLSLGALLLMMCIGGQNLSVASAAATAALSNAGPLLELTDAGGNYGQFSPLLQIVLIVGMILGRLEAAAALAIVSVAFWRS